MSAALRFDVSPAVGNPETDNDKRRALRGLLTRAQWNIEQAAQCSERADANRYTDQAHVLVEQAKELL